MTADTDELLFLDENESATLRASQASWTVLIVDDDEDVHSSTAFALKDARIFDRRITILNAYSAAEARELLAHRPDVAVILLDVVMESKDAGLTLARAIREEMQLHDLRIILRTGQPGYAPEVEVITAYDINDYKTKSELTQTRLLTAMIAALRSYRQILALNDSRRGLEMIIRASADLMTRRGLDHFSQGIITQLAALLSVPAEGLICVIDRENGEPHVIAAAGPLTSFIGSELRSLDDSRARELIYSAFKERDNLFEPEASVLFLGAQNDLQMAAYVATHRKLERHEQYLLRVFCQNIALANDNLSLIDRLHRLAYQDPLSQLPNRASFVEAITQALQSGGSDPVLIALDIDHFGATNETIGFRDGNQLLMQTGIRLRANLPPEVVVARIGGDTFGLLGDGSALSGSAIRELFSRPIDLSGLSLSVSLSSGRVALNSLESREGEDALRAAFIALKRAKENRRGSEHEFTPALSNHLRDRTTLLQGMRQAIEAQEFFLVYQPQIDLPSGRVVGVEALIRWRRKSGDFISPDRFIDIAETSGLIIVLGEFVMGMACLQLAQLRQAGYNNLRMAINVSMVQWLDSAFIPMVETMLAEHQLPPHLVELEITESVAMQGAEPVRNIMQRLKSLGVQMALDDFGTGFSSLSYLQQLPVDRLKVDKSFVSAMETMAPSRALVETVLRLGQNLGLQIIAEGIETEGQAELLTGMGCHEGQGYLYAKPMPAAQLLEWLAARQ